MKQIMGGGIGAAFVACALTVHAGLPSGSLSNLLVSIEREIEDVTLEVGWPDGFGDGLEIFAATDLVGGVWQLGCTNISTLGTNRFLWTDGSVSNLTSRFYLVGNADLDSDNDGVADAREMLMYGTDAHNPDSDADGMDDGWEIAYGFDPLTDDADGDADGDGLSNVEEYVIGSDPRRGVEATGATPFNVVFYQPTGGA